MSKWLTDSFLLKPAVLGLGVGVLSAAEFIGYVSDEKCARAGNAPSEGHAKCSQSCVEAGESIVFINDIDKKIYKIVDGLGFVRDKVGSKVRLDAEAGGSGKDLTLKIRSAIM